MVGGMTIALLGACAGWQRAGSPREQLADAYGLKNFSTGFARLELGLFTKPSVVMTFYDFIKFGVIEGIKKRPSSGARIDINR